MPGMEREQVQREQQREGLERSQEQAKQREFSREERSFVARSIEKCEARARPAEQHKDEKRDAGEKSFLSKGEDHPKDVGHDQAKQISQNDRRELREERISALTASILNEKGIEQRFDGRGWEKLRAEEKAELFRDCEKVCAGLEGRDRAKIVVKGDKELDGAHGAYRDATNDRGRANEIWLNEQKVFGPNVSKLDAVGYLFHEQAHANQRDMVGHQEIDKSRLLTSHVPSKWAGEVSDQRIAEISENFRPENRKAGGGQLMEHIEYLSQAVEIHAREVAQDRKNRISIYLDRPE